jgi:fructosamine-3-kinase
MPKPRLDFRVEIESATGGDMVDIEPMGGGCVSAVYEVRLDGGRRLVAKIDEEMMASLTVEAFMLRYLAERSRLPVPAVHFASRQLLLLEYVPGASRFSPAAERRAAELLAELHEITAPEYGFVQDTVIGGLRQPNPPEDSWIEFFRRHRLLYMAGEAVREGRLPQATFARIERLSDQLERWLVEPERPSLIHGDVWTTNVLAEGDQITAFLDPAIYFAHAEIELAFTTLFGTFGPAFYERYHQIQPIAPGFFEARRDIYNLYPLLVHVRLFGGSYVNSVHRILEQFGY